MHKKNILATSVLSFVLLLSACGGGSSGGGGGNFAGTYIGPATVTVSAGGISDTARGAQQIVIRQDGTVTVSDPGQPSLGTGTLNGNRFTVNIPASSINEPGISCVGALIVRGTVNGNTITGNITSSQVRCNGIPFTITGNFSAERTGPPVQNRSEHGLMQQIGAGISARGI